jgi:hypothetical protein
MTLKEIQGILALGSVFAIKTEKTVFLLPGAPTTTMTKISQYGVTTDVGNPEPAPWWEYTNTKNIVMKTLTGQLYLLCKICPQSGVRGSSVFHPCDVVTGLIDEETIYQKRQLTAWLPPVDKFDIGTVLTLPIDGILELSLIKLQDKPDRSGVKNLSKMQVQAPAPVVQKTATVLANNVPDYLRRNILQSVLADVKRAPKDRHFSEEHIQRVLKEYLPVWEESLKNVKVPMTDLDAPRTHKSSKSYGYAEEGYYTSEPYTVSQGVPNGF